MLTAVDRPDVVELTVSDDGPGVADELREDVFQPGVTYRRAGRPGLGIARRVARSFGGEIDPGRRDRRAPASSSRCRGAGRHGALPHGLLAVDRLADDVGVAGVLGGLGDDVREDPPGRPPRAGREPRRLGQRLAGSRSTVATRASVAAATASYSSSRPARVSPSSIRNPSAYAATSGGGLLQSMFAQSMSGWAAGPVLDEPGPVLLGGGHVLDQAAEGQLADRGAGAGLLVGQALDGRRGTGRGACGARRGGRRARR